MNAHTDIRFSVVIPVYNNRNTLLRCVESVLQQSFPAQEIIVVDDGSTDGSVVQLDSLSAANFRLICLPQNAGPSAARNAGLELATGSFIAFLDADDYWLPQKLERMAAVLGMYPEAVLVYHDHALAPIPMATRLPQKVSLRQFLMRNPAATPCTVVKRSHLRFYEDLHRMEDWDFFLCHAEAGTVIYLPETLTILGREVLSPGGQSSNRLAMRRSEWQVVRRFAERHPAYKMLLPFWLVFLLAKHGYQQFIKP